MWCSSRPQPRPGTTWSSCSGGWPRLFQAWSPQRRRRTTWRTWSWQTLQFQISISQSQDVLAETTETTTTYRLSSWISFCKWHQHFIIIYQRNMTQWNMNYDVIYKLLEMQFLQGFTFQNLNYPGLGILWWKFLNFGLLRLQFPLFKHQYWGVIFFILRI